MQALMTRVGIALLAAALAGIAAAGPPSKVSRPAPGAAAPTGEKRCSWRDVASGAPKSGMCYVAPETAVGSACICQTTHVGPSGVEDAHHSYDTHHGLVVDYPPPGPAERFRSRANEPVRP